MTDPARDPASDPAPDEFTGPVDYRLATGVVVRFVGAAVVLLAVVMFAGTVLVAAAGWPAGLLVVLLATGVATVLALAWYLRTRAWVLRCSGDGYRVRMVRGAGVTEARWTAVEDAVTAVRHDVPCLVLRLKDGRTTTIPVGVLAVDREQFVRELQGHLQRGAGLRPWRRGQGPSAGSG